MTMEKRTATAFAALLVVFLGFAAAGAGVRPAAGEQAARTGPAPTTREMNLLCWQEFGELVPERITTVLVPMGSLEPHGVIPNGTDNIVPEALARAIADRIDALVAPTLNFGVTAAMKAFPGAISISEAVYGPFVEEVLRNLADNGFRNLIVLNGHGGNTALLNAAATRVANACRVRILVVNWWTLADGVTKAVFKENGGHAGNNETAYVQAVVPAHIHPERYAKEMALPNAPAGAFLAVPVTATIGLYEKGQGYPTFDGALAKEYFARVNDLVAGLVEETIRQWDRAGVYR
jgi:creatinine amidohydrolase